MEWVIGILAALIIVAFAFAAIYEEKKRNDELFK